MVAHKVSILIPFKNTQAFIAQCLDSILKQTYKNWEAIIVDDHSLDESALVVGAYAKKDTRIKLHANSGRGIIAALRTALHFASGEFITRMDSDDLMAPQRLEKMVEDLKIHGRNHIALGQVKYFRAEGISNGYMKYEKWINQLTAQGKNFSEIYKECVIPSPCWMVHRKDLLSCDAFNPERYPEDYDLTFRFYARGLKCIPSNEVLLHWRDYSYRTSRTHEHYANNTFINLKVYYFLKLNYDASRPLVIWGAGQKGKRVAQLLQEANTSFHWVCDNPKKIDKKIYNVLLKKYTFINELKYPQSIVTVANEDAQKAITAYLQQLNMVNMKDYFFFC